MTGFVPATHRDQARVKRELGITLTLDELNLILALGGGPLTPSEICGVTGMPPLRVMRTLNFLQTRRFHEGEAPDG